MPRRMRNLSSGLLIRGGGRTTTRHIPSDSSRSPHPQGISRCFTNPAGAARSNESAARHQDILANLHRPASRRSMATSSSLSVRILDAAASNGVPRTSKSVGSVRVARRSGFPGVACRSLSMSRTVARLPSRRAACPPSRAKSDRLTLHSIRHVLAGHGWLAPHPSARRSVHPAISARNPPALSPTSAPTATYPSARSHPAASRLRF